MDESFFVLVVLYAKAGREAELREQLKAIVEPSRRDAGNLRYELFGQQDDPRRFIFVEHWESPQAQEAHHTGTEHIRRFQEQGSDAVERVELLYRMKSLA
jgi:quinol monooxygenase YgiN